MSTKPVRCVASRWFAKLVLALVAGLLALGIGEISVRVLGLAPQVKPIVFTGNTAYKRSTNPILSFDLKANHRDEKADLNRSYPSTNSHGQRDIERTIAKPSGVKRILLLGDSVVEGHGIRAIDDTMSRRLERLYEDDKTEVLNFGVSGYCTLAEVELLRVKGLKFQPDVVVLVFVDNDFDNFNREAFQLGGPVSRPKVVKYLFANCHLFRLLCLKLNLFYFGAEADPVRWNKGETGDNNVVDGLKLLSQLAETYGFQPIIAIWPGFLDDRIIDFHTMPRGCGELVIERLGWMRGIRTVRLLAYFKQHRQQVSGSANPRLRYTLGDQMHPSEVGCRVAAKALKQTIDQLTESPSTYAAKSGRGRDVADDSTAVAAASALGTKEPDYAFVYNNVGMALLEAGRLDGAIDQFRLALQVRPDDAEVHNNLGVALGRQGRPDQAIKHYQRALELRPLYAEAHCSLGIVLRERGELDEAIDHFYQSLRIKPDYAKAHNYIAVALKLNGQLDEALRHYRDAIRFEPDWPGPLNDMAWLLATYPDATVRDPDKAVELAQLAARLDGHQSAAILDALAAAYAAAGRFDMAIATAEQALRRPTYELLAREIRRHLAVYRESKPYREPSGRPKLKAESGQ